MIRQNFLSSSSAANLKKFMGTLDSNINDFYNIFERIMRSTGLLIAIANEMLILFLGRDPLSFFEKQPNDIKSDFYKMKSELVINYSLLGVDMELMHFRESITQKPGEMFASFQNRIEIAVNRGYPSDTSEHVKQLKVKAIAFHGLRPEMKEVIKTLGSPPNIAQLRTWIQNIEYNYIKTKYLKLVNICQTNEEEEEEDPNVCFSATTKGKTTKPIFKQFNNNNKSARQRNFMNNKVKSNNLLNTDTLSKQQFSNLQKAPVKPLCQILLDGIVRYGKLV